MRVLSGMRPTGRLHLGHWMGALSKWVQLQQEYECFFMIADWHALMSEYKEDPRIREYSLDNIADWLSWGVSPSRSTIFIQSQVKEHLELFMLFSILMPLGRLYRCPTFKEQIQQLSSREVNTYAFLGYPVLQAADILVYKAEFVPVGEDQLPHLELARELVRRFHNIFGREVFPEPQALLTQTPRLLGLDGRKMSKSYDNCLYLSDEDEVIKKKVQSMFTDPQRIRKNQPGRPQVCNVYTYYTVFFPEKKDEVFSWCTQAQKGCTECKSVLSELIIEFIKPRRLEKKRLLEEKDYLLSLIEEGGKKAQAIASSTLKEIREIVGI